VVVPDNDSSTDGGDEPPFSFGGKMHKIHIRGAGEVLHEVQTITRATPQPVGSPRTARSYSDATTETDQDTAEPQILFRPRLHFVPE
jgi:hypothetical protein